MQRVAVLVQTDAVRVEFGIAEALEQLDGSGGIVGVGGLIGIGEVCAQAAGGAGQRVIAVDHMANVIDVNRVGQRSAEVDLVEGGALIVDIDDRGAVIRVGDNGEVGIGGKGFHHLHTDVAGGSGQLTGEDALLDRRRVAHDRHVDRLNGRRPAEIAIDRLKDIVFSGFILRKLVHAAADGLLHRGGIFHTLVNSGINDADEAEAVAQEVHVRGFEREAKLQLAEHLDALDLVADLTLAGDVLVSRILEGELDGIRVDGITVVEELTREQLHGIDLVVFHRVIVLHHPGNDVVFHVRGEQRIIDQTVDGKTGRGDVGKGGETVLILGDGDRQSDRFRFRLRFFHSRRFLGCGIGRFFCRGSGRGFLRRRGCRAAAGAE